MTFRRAIATVSVVLLGLATVVTGLLDAAPAGAAPDATVIGVIAGTGTSGLETPGPASASSMLTPSGTAVDSLGNLYVVDFSALRVYKIDASGTLSIFAGSGAQGAPVAGPATASPLSNPWGVAVDASGNVYIADSSNFVVEKVTPSGTLSIFAGNGSNGAVVPGPATASPLGVPVGVAADGAGNVYIADHNSNRVLKVDAGGTLSVLAGNGTGAAPVAGPATASPLNGPYGVAADAAGNVYIADTGNSRIEKVSSSGTLSLFAGTGSAGSSVAGPATASPVNQPMGVAADAAGNVYVLDTQNNRVEMINTSGMLSFFAGNGTFNAPIPGAATASPLGFPYGIAVGSSGKVYIADTANHRVEMVASSAVPVFFGAAPPAGFLGTPYSFGFVAAWTAPITFTVSSGSLPPGLNLSGAGVLSGTPTGIGSYPFVIAATSGADSALTGTITMNVGYATPVFSSASPDPATLDAAYTYTFVASGFPAPTYAVGSGSLPPGLALDPATGVLSGTPTVPGSYPFAITASSGTASASSGPITMDLTPVAPMFTSATPDPAFPGVAYDYRFAASGNPAPMFSVSSGTVPAGLTLDPSSGRLAGTPTEPGMYDFEVTATNTAAATPSGPITMTVADPAPAGGGVASTPGGAGYWALTPGGALSNHGNAPDLGSMNGSRLKAPLVGVSATPSGTGYWLAASDGGVFSFGDATFYGSTGALKLKQPVNGIARTPDGKGYWLVASDGGVFTFGDATFYGSTGALTLDQPIVGISSTPDGRGYWLVASDGGVFSFGDARFSGSLGATRLDAPIVAITPSPSGRGYWLVARDGGVFNFGDAAFHGSLGGLHASSFIGMIPNGDAGYRLVSAAGVAYPFGDTR